MQKMFAVSTNRIIGFVCCALLPMAMLGVGFYDLVTSVMVTPFFWVAFLLVPLIEIGVLALCMFFNCKIWKKLLLTYAVLVLFSILGLFVSMLAGNVKMQCYEGVEAEQQYAAAKGENTLMPEWADVTGNAGAKYCHVISNAFIFSSETDYLICNYTPEEYAIQKAQLDIQYTFQTEAIIDENEICEPMTAIDGYQFRMLSVDTYEESLYYPKQIVLIGCSDDARKIVYLLFEDWDLDYLSSLEQFIIDECGWKYIHKR